MSLSDLSWLDLNEAQHKPQRPTAFDYATRLVVPVVAIVASIIRPSEKWILVGLAFFSLALAFVTPLVAFISRRRSRANDDKAARIFFPELTNLANQFAAYVNPSRSDTLHYAVHSELCNGNGALISKLCLPDLTLWNGQLSFFIQRLRTQRATAANVLQAMQEFHFIVGSYVNQCASAVFDRMPQELATLLTGRTKSSLNSIQMRLEHFLSDCEGFSNRVCASRSIFGDLPRAFTHPKPLA
jgi:hypothetical protein